GRAAAVRIGGHWPVLRIGANTLYQPSHRIVLTELADIGCAGGRISTDRRQQQRRDSDRNIGDAHLSASLNSQNRSRLADKNAPPLCLSSSDPFLIRRRKTEPRLPTRAAAATGVRRDANPASQSPSRCRGD